MDIEKQNKNEKDKHKVKIKGEDRISNLPDPILHHILSFLPTKSAACTSILSKRWRNLWVFTPVLDFRNWGFTNERRSHSTAEIFMNFVDRMLSFHDDHMPNIKKLYLDIENYFGKNRVDAWISKAIKRKVEELYINFGPASQFTVTPRLCCCESLTIMEIELGGYLELPESICFPRLKILRLSCVKFTKYDSTKELFFNFPVLEELIFYRCKLDWLNVFSISAPQLKCLSIDGATEILYDCLINIYAPNLLFLKYIEFVTEDVDLHSFPSIVDAEIDFDYENSSPEIGYTANKFIGGLCNVKLLKLSGKTFEALSFADGLLTTLPTFNNLTHLEVGFLLSCLNKKILDFLQITPNLESLVFPQGVERGSSNDDDSWTLNLVPQCLLLHLKTVKFKKFDGHFRELNLIKLFLKEAGILESMTVIFSSTLSMDMKNTVKELLQRYLRASTACVIEVHM